jgi:hypothetical protein
MGRVCFTLQVDPARLVFNLDAQLRSVHPDGAGRNGDAR